MNDAWISKGGAKSIRQAENLAQTGTYNGPFGNIPLSLRGGEYLGARSTPASIRGSARTSEVHCRLAIRLAGVVRVHAALRYSLAPDKATGRVPVQGELELLQHTADLLFGVELAFGGGAIGGRVTARGGPSITRVDATFEGVDASGTELRLPLEVAAGPTFRLGSGWSWVWTSFFEVHSVLRPRPGPKPQCASPSRLP